MIEPLSTDSVVRIPAHVRSIVDPAGAVLLDLKAGKYYSLNTVGALIWTGLECGAGIAEIVADVSGRSGVAADVVQRDVRRFVSRLGEKGLLYAGD